MKKEDVMRRISVALDSPDGLVGDPAIQEELRADPEMAKYAKDVTRVGKWLATWPLPEPDDAAFEALAARIEQRLDESLSTMSDPTAAPVFDDDDALRDATARLLNSGEFPLSDSSIELVSDPSNPGLVVSPVAAAAPPAPPAAEAKPVAPIARVALSKARAPAIVEELPPGSGEPRSAAELELSLVDKPKKIGPSGTATKKKKKKAEAGAPTSSDRISIPTPKPVLGAPSLSPVVQLPKAEDRKPAGTLWWFAAAAAVGLGVFGAATLFEGAAEPPTAATQGSTLVTTGALAPSVPAAVAPTTPAEEPDEAAPTVVALPPLPPATMAARGDIAEAEEQRPTTTATATSMPAPRMRPIADPTAAPMQAPMRIATGAGRAEGTGGAADREVDDLLAGAEGPRRRAAPPPATTTASTTTTPSVTAPPPPPPPTPAGETATHHASTPTPSDDTADLPSTPDRSTIQAVLSARADAVAACANGAHGLADVDIVIAGSGRITTATVNGTFAGTPVGSCIARAVRGATFPPFAQSRFEVTYPYHL